MPAYGYTSEDLRNLDKIDPRTHCYKDDEPFKVGQRVYVRGSAFTTPRRGRVGSITTNHSGMTVYILEDGGMFSWNELKAD